MLTNGNQVGKLENEKKECVKQLNSYKSSQQYAEKLLDQLKDITKKMGIVVDDLKKYLVIDGKTIMADKTQKMKENINSMINTLNSYVIPSIKTEIKNLEARIRKLDSTIAQLNMDSKMIDIQ